MSLDQAEYAPFEPERSSLEEVLLDIDENNEYYQEAASFWLSRPTTRRAKNFLNASKLVAVVFTNSVESIISEPEMEEQEKAKILSHLLVDSSQQRVNFFNRLLPDNEFEPAEIDREAYEQGITEALLDNEEEEVLETLSDTYVHILNVENAELQGAISDTRKAKLLKAGQEITKHAAEVSKLTAGVVVGTLISSYIIDRYQK